MLDRLCGVAMAPPYTLLSSGLVRSSAYMIPRSTRALTETSQVALSLSKLLFLKHNHQGAKQIYLHCETVRLLCDNKLSSGDYSCKTCPEHSTTIMGWIDLVKNQLKTLTHELEPEDLFRRSTQKKIIL